MPNVEVNCTVSNCIFHATGNVCGAEKIEVDMDTHAKQNNTEFASEFVYSRIAEKASSSAETCCKTFKPKEDM